MSMFNKESEGDEEMEQADAANQDQQQDDNMNQEETPDDKPQPAPESHIINSTSLSNSMLKSQNQTNFNRIELTRTEGMNVASMLAPRTLPDCERNESLVTFGKPQSLQKPMFIDDIDESSKYQNQLNRDDEEVKQYPHTSFKEELKEEIDEDGNVLRPSANENHHSNYEQSQETDMIEPIQAIRASTPNREIIEERSHNDPYESSRNNSYNEIIDQEEEEHDRQVDMAMEERINTRVTRNRTNANTSNNLNNENSTLHEVQSSVGNLSSAINPNIQLFHEAPVSNRNPYTELSDDEDLETILGDYSK